MAGLFVFVVLPLSSTAVAQTIGVDYGKLDSQQQELFRRFLGCSAQTCPERWQRLNSSQQLEFAGATQALRTVQLQPNSGNGLDEVDTVTRVHGSEPSHPSQDQFNVETEWKTGAADQFERAAGWSEHIAILHKGQYGYQENQEGNPFLGLVALFDKKPVSRKGQFHIDFRSWFAHYCADNGNISANYPEYARWYGPIPGYMPIFKLIFPDLASDLSWYRQKRNEIGSQTSTCSTNIRESIREFLTTWYINNDLQRLSQFVAQDNVYNIADLDRLGVRSPLALWSRLFSDAFESSPEPISTLSDALEYQEPQFRDANKKLRYLNAEEIASGTASYAIIDPESTPLGSLFPRIDASDSKKSGWDLQAKFLSYLYERYQRDLYVVIYRTIGPKLVPETVIQYWIKENSCWKIAAFQGTGW